MRDIFTIGYEGSAVGDFIATLRLVGIETLVDVRALPLSRKPGFSKTPLAAALAESDLSYLHLSALGDPKPGRDAARSGDLKSFRRIFGTHLRQSDLQAALGTLAELAAETTVCLLCFERDHRHCHRSMISEALLTIDNFRIKNIDVHNDLLKLPKAKRVAVARDVHSR